jgi:putative transposase
MAKAVGINPKNIYRECRQPLKDRLLKAEIETAHHEHPAYGHRRMADHLGVNHKRTQRVMAQFNLRPPRRTTRSDYCTRSTTPHSYPNLLKKLEAITMPHHVWCSDLTRVVYRGAIWYLATIEDIATRQIIAHRLGKRHNSQLVFDTLQDAFAKEGTPAIFHSDQGNEFMAQLCTQSLEDQGVLVSVSDAGSPWQNPHQESFFGRFKAEFGEVDRFDSTGHFLEAIHHHIHYYNHQYIHTSLRMPPALFAAKYLPEFCLQ